MVVTTEKYTDGYKDIETTTIDTGSKYDELSTTTPGYEGTDAVEETSTEYSQTTKMIDQSTTQGYESNTEKTSEKIEDEKEVEKDGSSREKYNEQDDGDRKRKQGGGEAGGSYHGYETGSGGGYYSKNGGRWKHRKRGYHQSSKKSYKHKKRTSNHSSKMNYGNDYANEPDTGTKSKIIRHLSKNLSVSSKRNSTQMVKRNITTRVAHVPGQLVTIYRPKHYRFAKLNVRKSNPKPDPSPSKQEKSKDYDGNDNNKPLMATRGGGRGSRWISTHFDQKPKPKPKVQEDHKTFHYYKHRL